MGKTEKEYKGKKYKPRKRDGKGKSKADKKFFGFTSGTHSRKENGEVAVKDKDFVKYGWPMETRHRKVIKRKQQERDADNEIKNIKKK